MGERRKKSDKERRKKNLKERWTLEYEAEYKALQIVATGSGLWDVTIR